MIEPIQIVEESENRISIIWSDNLKTDFIAASLRKACPCASCVNEWTGERILKEDSISDELTFLDMELVGRYALNFRFSDGHDTGIFTFKYLRQITENSVN